MTRVWAFFYAARGRTDLRGSIEHWLYKRDGAYRRYYRRRRGDELPTFYGS